MEKFERSSVIKRFRKTTEFLALKDLLEEWIGDLKDEYVAVDLTTAEAKDKLLLIKGKIESYEGLIHFIEKV